MGKKETNSLQVLAALRRRVAELEKTHAEFEQLSKRYRTTLESITDGFVSFDKEWRYTYVNETALRLLQKPREELLGRTPWEVFPESSHLKFYTEFTRSCDQDAPVHFEEFYPEPLNRWFECHCYPEPDGLSVYFRDVTERKRAEERLRQSQKMEAIGTLAGGIAHDFNNILASILGFTEMAMEDVRDRPPVEKKLKNVFKSAMRARELVKQILSFSRKANHERSLIALSPLIQETVQLLRASIPATVKINLAITATSDTILAAPVEVQQILMNLASNASLAMRETGGTLEISLGDIDVKPGSPGWESDVVPGEYVQLVVKDTGIGMSPDVMKRIFEPFFTTREVGKGTGMGLAVAYGTVKDLQGTITVESEPGAGSTFRVLFPKVKTEVKEEKVPTLQAYGDRKRILFVDDEEMAFEWGQATLERLGYSVTALTDPTEALKTFSSDPSRFDLVITDQVMPSMTGVQLAREFLTVRPDIPVILYTGHSETVSPETAKAAGIREYLTKPLARQELAQAIRHVLDANTERGRRAHP